MKKTYFVSGIDTGIGKTAAVGVMAKSLRDCNVNAITFKLVQTGNQGQSEDILEHRRIMGCGLLPEDEIHLTCPEIYSFPSSPLLASQIDRRPIDLNTIQEAVIRLGMTFDVVLVEGAGGLAVPLTGDLLTIDFAASLKWPLILVSCGRLGSLNHTLLSLEAAAARGMEVAGVIYNYYPDADPLIDRDSPVIIRKYLKKLGMRDALVRLPKLVDPIPHIDFSAIFEE